MTTGHPAGVQAPPQLTTESTRKWLAQRSATTARSWNGAIGQAKLTARAKEAETRAAAARSKARADLEQEEVSSARSGSGAERQAAPEGREQRGPDLGLVGRHAQKSWNERIDAVREDIESKKTAHDVGKARWKADRAEDAMLAIDAAYWAIDEADYAVLDAVLARMDADDAAAAAGEAPQPS